MSDVLVTVLIPAKDEAPWIGACLASVAAQDYPHHLLEVIVVVDGVTTDATAHSASTALAHSDYFHAEVVRHASAGTPAASTSFRSQTTGTFPAGSRPQ